LMTISLAPFQIPQMVRVTGVSGLSAVSPVGMATRNGLGPVAMRVLQQNLGPVTIQTALVSLHRTVSPSSVESFVHLYLKFCLFKRKSSP
jgi:hypothetical protein